MKYASASPKQEIFQTSKQNEGIIIIKLRLSKFSLQNRKITLAATVIALVVNICFFIIVIVLVQRRPSIG